MPELPEVEVTRQGIAPHLLNQTISAIIVRNASLRWPVPDELQLAVGLSITQVSRRAKYLLLTTALGQIVVHLGMSGSLRVVDSGTPAAKHDHVDLCLANGRCIRYNDPRRFGSWLWQGVQLAPLSVLEGLGPEPLSEAFNGNYLYQQSRKRKQAIKTFIMDNRVVVGVGNIYANEALFNAGIRPAITAGTLSRARLMKLVDAIKAVLQAAIEQGGTTLKDFTNSDGKPGYFAQQLNVYGRAGEGCFRCGSEVQHQVLGQRASFFCPRCQS